MTRHTDSRPDAERVPSAATPVLARVAAAIAPLLGEPRAAGTQISQYLNGARLVVQESRGDWARVRGRDQYEGWMHRGYVDESEDVSGHEEWVSLGCVARSVDGSTRRLPLGALLDAGEKAVAGETVRRVELSVHFPTVGAAIAASALRFFEGTSYQWGGVTPWGADCSGLVQSIFGLHGVLLPRDASDQAQCGVDVAAIPDALMAGDLLFFSDRDDGRITHVAIAIGDGRIVHLALGRGGYAVERLSGTGDAYVEALRTRIRGARRVIGAEQG